MTEAQWKQVTEFVKPDVEILTTRPQLMNQAQEILDKSTDCFYWECIADPNFIGVTAGFQSGPLWSFVQVSSLHGLQLARDILPTFNLDQVIYMLTQNPLLKPAASKMTCKCGANSPVEAFDVGNKGADAIQLFLNELFEFERKHKMGLVLQSSPDDDETVLFEKTLKAEPAGFQKLINCLGKMTNMASHQGYSGDVAAADFECCYGVFEKHELLTHVLTRLPLKLSDGQQIERKRHVGNDGVVIVYRPFQAAFEPNEFIASRQIRIYLLVEETGTDTVTIKAFARGVNTKYICIEKTDWNVEDPKFAENLNRTAINCCFAVYSDPLLAKKLHAKWAELIRSVM